MGNFHTLVNVYDAMTNLAANGITDALGTKIQEITRC
jgi:hypothetical protein